MPRAPRDPDNDGKKHHAWAFTWNNYTDETISRLEKLGQAISTVKYLAYGKEVAPTTGTPHLQGVIVYVHAQHFNTVRAQVGVKCVPRYKNSTDDKLIDYCQKDHDFTEYGTRPAQGERTDLETLRDQIAAGTTTVDDILREHPSIYHQYGRTLCALEDSYMRDRYRTEQTHGLWVYGCTGLGKSNYAFHLFRPKTHYVFKYESSGWQDGYRQQPIVIMDEFRGQIPYAQMLRILDRHPSEYWSRRNREPVPFVSKKVIITSSLHPTQVYKNLARDDNIAQLLRRLRIIHLTELHDEDFDITTLPDAPSHAENHLENIVRDAL